mmetsp:Transcript_40459/g.29134  ORF Transcript_40459/g.29134 Transcript_40459/m.29134 type:complete len:137 (-) Transcript_40459:398-808(-)
MLKARKMSFVFELFATFLFTILFVTCNARADDFQVPQQGPLLLGLWVITIFSFKVSGSHLNPAITLAYIFRRDRMSFPRTLGICYIVAQIIGAMLGALLMDYIEYPLYELRFDHSWVQCLLAEIIGTFLLTFFYLT